MSTANTLEFGLNWNSLLLAGAVRGIGSRDLQRVKSYLRQRFDLDEPRWVAPYQQPKRMLAGLRSIPVYPSDAFPWVAGFESAHASILEEYEGLAKDVLRPHPQDLAVKGRWNVAYLYNRGRTIEQNSDRCPKTMAALKMIPGAGVAGEVYFSIMVPGTYVRPHCGPTNARIRCHLCLTEARDCWIRVGDQKLQWHAGRCLIFDDSFEHEVAHEGDTPRAVLITDFWHPDLTAAEQWALGTMRSSLRLTSRYRRFVKKAGKMLSLGRSKG